MQIAPLPQDETKRLQALRDLCLLDTPLEERFERIIRLLAHALNTPINAFTLVDGHRQWFKSIQGLNISETPRDVSFCSHVILEDEIMQITDARDDARFADNPAVTGDINVRFYAGCPVHAPNGQRIGVLCAIDNKPRVLTERELQTLRDLTSLL